MAITGDQLAPVIGNVLNASTRPSATITFTNQPSVKSVILVALWTSGTSPQTISVADNAVIPNTYVQDERFSANSNAALTTFVYRTNAGTLSLPASGNLAITVTQSASSGTFIGFGARSYLGMQFLNEGYATLDSGSATGLAISKAPNLSGELFFSIFNDNTGANPGTPGINAPFTLLGNVTNGSSSQVGGMAEFIASDSNAQVASWSLLENAASSCSVILTTFPPVQNVPVAGKDISLQAIKRASIF